jgi:hypothetical protein
VALTLADMLVELGTAGIALRVRGGVLQMRCPKTVAERFEPHRETLLGVVDGYAPFSPEECYVFLERLGVGEDFGMPITPGSPAWLLAVGEAMRADEADRVRYPGLDITPERLDAWDAYAGGKGNACARAERFIQEAWRRVNRLESKGVERTDAVSAVLAAMEAPAHTFAENPVTRGIVECQRYKVPDGRTEVGEARATLRRTGGRGAAA